MWIRDELGLWNCMAWRFGRRVEWGWDFEFSSAESNVKDVGSKLGAIICHGHCRMLSKMIIDQATVRQF